MDKQIVLPLQALVKLLTNFFLPKTGNEHGIFVLLSFIFSHFTAESHKVATKIMDRLKLTGQNLG
jgi:hypothetical protein